MRARFGARKPESLRLRFRTQTAAATLTKPQYQVNIIRTTLQALSAVLGGTQSLHTNGMDEAFTIPSEEAMKIALRTQQVIADETNIPAVVDPLGGSYYVESLTTQIKAEIMAILDNVEGMGGTIKAIEIGWFQREIADSAYDSFMSKSKGTRPVIGVNKYVEPEEQPHIEIHPHDPTAEQRQIANLQRVRAERDEARVQQLLAELRQVAADEEQNIMPVTIELVKAGASMGDIVETLKAMWGTYRKVPVI